MSGSRNDLIPWVQRSCVRAFSSVGQETEVRRLEVKIAWSPPGADKLRAFMAGPFGRLRAGPFGRLRAGRKMLVFGRIMVDL
jgi:hypothetical protein